MSSLETIQQHLDMLEKVTKYERKNEFNRFLLILCVGGYVTFIGGWVAYIFNSLYNVDPSFFLFNLTGDPALSPTSEPVLFITVWLIYLIPIVSVIVFSTGSTGIINWNRAYRNIALLAIILFFLVHILLLIAGLQNMKYFPAIWGFVVCLGFVISSWFIKPVTENMFILNGLIVFGIIALILGILASLWIPIEYAQLIYNSGLGLTLSCVSLIGYYLSGRST